MNFWNHFIASPFITIKNMSRKPLIWESLLSILMVSLVPMTMAALNLSSKISFWLILFLFLFSILFLQSTIIDFIAQLFHFPASNFILMQRLAISLVPCIFWVPITIISIQWNIQTSFVINILKLSVLFWVLSLQIYSIQCIYETTPLKSISLFLMPLLIGCAFVGLNIIFLISFAATAF